MIQDAAKRIGTPASVGQTSEANPYVPVNGPAIGDLFDMFDFGSGNEWGR